LTPLSVQNPLPAEPSKTPFGAEIRVALFLSIVVRF
jgi:hypothetical protein